jgi:hypothetical protein
MLFILLCVRGNPQPFQPYMLRQFLDVSLEAEKLVVVLFRLKHESLKVPTRLCRVLTG